MQYFFVLAQRFSSRERNIAFRCKFRNIKREKNESVTIYGYQLKKLAQKAYPSMTNDDLEPLVIDLYVHSLSNYELQKHVQFSHPKTLNEVIALATEYKALEHFVDRVKKPQQSDSNLVGLISSDSSIQHITLEQISKMLDEKLNKILQSSTQKTWKSNKQKTQQGHLKSIGQISGLQIETTCFENIAN